MAAVTLPAIRAARLSDETTRRYELAYRLALGECRDEDCRHRHALAGLSIHDAMRPRALKDCLEEVARQHGAQSAKHARIVLRKYLAGPLRVDELIPYNPLADLDVDLSEAREPAQRRGGQSLTLEQYRAVVDHLLVMDPTDVRKPRQGRWTRQDLIRERRALVDIVLAQATTGLRTSELCRRPAGECSVDYDGTFVFWLPAPATKTRRSRPVPVLDPRVSERLAARLAGVQQPQHPLFPTPTDPAKEWDARNRDRKLASLYMGLADDLGIPMLETERGHSWRTTLNSLLHDAVDEATRIRLLGHTTSINRSHYTAVTSTAAVVEAASVLRSPQESPQAPGSAGQLREA